MELCLTIGQCQGIGSFVPTTTVRPYIEYANTTWSLTKMKAIIAIENVQRRATKYLPLLKHMTHEERLNKLNLPTLQYRRLKIQTYTILTGCMIELWDPIHAPPFHKSSKMRPYSEVVSTDSRKQIEAKFYHHPCSQLVEITSRSRSSWSTYPYSFWKESTDVAPKEDEWKFKFRNDYNPIANQMPMSIAEVKEGMAAADDLDIKAYACVQ